MAATVSGWHWPARIALAGTIMALATLSAPADARPPQVTSAGVTNGIATATWSLPSTVRAEFFELATHPDVNVYGYFRQINQVRFGVLYADQTSLTSDDAKPPLPPGPGTYYIHIAGHDRVYDGCPTIEFSDIVEITIKDGGAVESRLYGPGTGDCTRRANSPGGPASGGGSGGGGAKFNDETLPVAKLRYSSKQDIDKLRVRARMSEPGTLTARASVSVGGLLAKIYTFKPTSRRVTGGVLATLPLKLSKKHKRALKRALRRGKRLRARVAVTAMDRAGNIRTVHATIRLKR
jgi:hypothetical protein